MTLASYDAGVAFPENHGQVTAVRRSYYAGQPSAIALFPPVTANSRSQQVMPDVNVILRSVIGAGPPRPARGRRGA
jgi:hypothetical protein